MDGDSPLASPEPRVLYVGEDATGIAAQWNDGDRPDDGNRPFVLEPATPADALETFESATVDSVVCHSDGDDSLGAFVQAIREASQAVPIIVFATGGGVRPETAMAVGATYIDLDGDFDPIGRLSAVAPVVERHREEVRDRTMLDSLLEQIPLSVYWKDGRSRHVKVSDAMLSMIGPDHIENPEGKRFHSPEDVRGHTDWDIYPVDLAEDAVADDQAVMETEEPIVDRVEHSYGSRWDGTYVATSKAPWYDDQGRVIGMVGISRDVSERLQYEHQLERQNDRLERFARVISHDLRNPLEVAKGRLALARKSDDEADHFDAMDRALERMDALIDDVLTLAREGEVVADPEPVDLATAAGAAWDLVDTDGATLTIETDAEILADPGRLQQILENLFRNAIEHGLEAESDADSEARSDADEAAITITVGTAPAEGFFVADDGRGIDADVRDEIFEPGFSDGDTGTGLGLGIVQTIAEAHGWRIDVTESEGDGARFEFSDVRRTN